MGRKKILPVSGTIRSLSFKEVFSVNYQMQNQPDPHNTSGSGNGKKHIALGVLIAVLVLVFILVLLAACGVAAYYLIRNIPSWSASTISEPAAVSVPAESSVISSPSEKSSVAEVSKAESKLDVAEASSGRQEKSYAQVYAENVSSTVGITTSITTNFFGYKTTSAASGSGFFLTDDGYVLTNYHVIEGASSIKVTTYDDVSYTAELVGYSESNDIAVLKVDATGIDPVTIGHSSDMVVGDLVAAIGNPLGELTFSLTSGVISAQNRSVTTSSGTVMKLIQTDCAINSGNSGGALFNMYGEVIGITNAKYSGSVGGSASIDNIGFAIPIDSVIEMVRQIIKDGYVLQPYIGVSTQSVSNTAVRYYGYPQGAYVEMVARDGTADKAGVLQGDIITAVNDSQVTGRASLAEIIANCKIGSTVTLHIFRDGKYIDLPVLIGEKRQSLTSGSGASSSYT